MPASLFFYLYSFGSFFFSSRRRHTRCSRDWSSDVCSSDLVQLRPKIFQKDLGESIDVPQRGTQVVGDRISKGFELFIQGFQFGGPPAQVFVQLLDFLFGPFALGDVFDDSSKAGWPTIGPSNEKNGEQNGDTRSVLSYVLFFVLGRFPRFQDLFNDVRLGIAVLNWVDVPILFPIQ